MVFYCRHTGIIPKEQSFWDKQAIEKFKELLGKYHETGMIAIKKGIRPGPSGDILCLVLIDTATNNFDNGIQIHQEMLRLGLAEWKAGNDSGYTTSSPANERLLSRQNPNIALTNKGIIRVLEYLKFTNYIIMIFIKIRLYHSDQFTLQMNHQKLVS